MTRILFRYCADQSAIIRAGLVQIIQSDLDWEGLFLRVSPRTVTICITLGAYAVLALSSPKINLPNAFASSMASSRIEITQEAFDRFLHWLHPDVEQAACEYEALRRRVIAWFERLGCATAEELTDEAFNLVIRRVVALPDPSQIKPIPYFHRVVSRLHLEYTESYAKKTSYPSRRNSTCINATTWLC